jgi:hypothetical protein
MACSLMMVHVVEIVVRSSPDGIMPAVPGGEVVAVVQIGEQVEAVCVRNEVSEADFCASRTANW